MKFKDGAGMDSGQQGVTLAELMITLLILAVILALGVPSFRNSTASASIRGTAMDLVASLNAARAEAVSFRSPITVESAGGAVWSASGWKYTHPEDGEFAFRASGNTTVQAGGGVSSVIFGADGTVDLAGASELVLEVCDSRAGETGRLIRVNRLGRITNEELVCP